MSWFVLLVQVALSIMLVVAATGKLLQSDDFLAALRLSHLPEALVLPLAIAVPVLEFVLGLALVLAAAPVLPVVMLLTAAVLAVFTGWMAWVRARRLRVRCGCFGAASGEVGSGTIARNTGLLLVALAGAAVSARAPTPLPGPTLMAVISATALANVSALLWAGRQVWPELLVTFTRYQARQRTVGGE